MKHLHHLLPMGCLLASLALNAQTECSGVYLTAEDFVAGNRLPATDGRPRSGKAEEQVFNSKYIFVNQGDYHYKMYARDVYALQSCEGTIVRVYNDNYYNVLNPGEKILLYVVINPPFSKGEVWTRNYFFSKDAASEIRDLTLENLKSAFSGNPAFLEAVNSQFRSDRDLLAYDAIKKCYKINSAYSASR